MKKYIVITLLNICCFQFQGISQKICNCTIKGYPPDSLQAYFDSVHEIRKSKIESLTSSFYCAVRFNLVADSSIDDFKILEAPATPLNEEIREYIKELFKTTNGRWISTIDKNLSGTKLIFFVNMIKTSQDKKSRLETDMKFTDYMLFYVLGMIDFKDLKTPSNYYYIILKY